VPSRQVELVAAGLAAKDVDASIQAVHDVVLEAANVFEREWTARVNFSAICSFSKNDTQLHLLRSYIEDKVLAVLPVTQFVTPFYDALVCSRAYSHDVQERTMQSLDTTAEAIGKLLGLLALCVLTIPHDAAADVLFGFVAWLEACATAVEPAVDATDTVAQRAYDALCPSDDALDEAFKLHFYTDDMCQTLKQLFSSITVQMRAASHYCLSNTLRKLGKLFAEEKSPL
jgi:hypothetical protein